MRWGGRGSACGIYYKLHESGIFVSAARLCAPVHVSFSVHDVDSVFLKCPVVQTVQVGSAIVVPAVSVNLPAVHLVCSAASQGACGCGVGWKR